MLKEKYNQLRILHQAKISFRNEDKFEKFSDKGRLRIVTQKQANTKTLSLKNGWGGSLNRKKMEGDEGLELKMRKNIRMNKNKGKYNRLFLNNFLNSIWWLKQMYVEETLDKVVFFKKWRQ